MYWGLNGWLSSVCNPSLEEQGCVRRLQLSEHLIPISPSLKVPGVGKRLVLLGAPGL